MNVCACQHLRNLSFVNFGVITAKCDQLGPFSRVYWWIKGSDTGRVVVPVVLSISHFDDNVKCKSFVKQKVCAYIGIVRKSMFYQCSTVSLQKSCIQKQNAKCPACHSSLSANFPLKWNKKKTYVFPYLFFLQPLKFWSCASMNHETLAKVHSVHKQVVTPAGTAAISVSKICQADKGDGEKRTKKTNPKQKRK